MEAGREFHFQCTENIISAFAPRNKYSYSYQLWANIICFSEKQKVQTKKNILKSFIRKVGIEEMAIVGDIDAKKSLPIEYIIGKSSVLKRIDENNGLLNDAFQDLILISNPKNYKHYKATTKIYEGMEIGTETLDHHMFCKQKLNDILFVDYDNSTLLIQDVFCATLFEKSNVDIYKFLSCMNVCESKIIVVIKVKNGILGIEVRTISDEESCEKLFKSLKNSRNALIVMCRDELHDDLIQNLKWMKHAKVLQRLHDRHSKEFGSYLVDEIGYRMYGKYLAIR